MADPGAKRPRSKEPSAFPPTGFIPGVTSTFLVLVAPPLTTATETHFTGSGTVVKLRRITATSSGLTGSRPGSGLRRSYSSCADQGAEQPSASIKPATDRAIVFVLIAGPSPRG